MDTRTKRAAALGYGLAFLTILPATLDIPGAGQALGAYSYDLWARQNPSEIWVQDCQLVGSTLCSGELRGSILEFCP